MSPTMSRQRWGQRARTALVVMVFAVPLTVTWTVAGVHIAIGCGAVFALLLGILERRWPLSRTGAESGWYAWAVASLLAVLFAIPEAQSWQPLKKILLIPLAHVVGFALGGGSSRWALRAWIGAMALTACVAMIVFWNSDRTVQARLSAWSHYMTFAGQILLVLPAACCAVWATRGRLRLLYSVGAILLFLALVLTSTRSAWLGVLAALTLIVARVRPRLVWLIPVAAVLLLIVAPEGVRQRALSSFDPSHPANLERHEMWRQGLEIWRGHPWTGVGLGDLIPVRQMLVDDDVTVLHGHLHNNVVQVLAGRGVLGLVAFLWLNLSLARVLWRARSTDGEMAALLLGMWGSFWGFHLMGMFEWNFSDVEIMIPLLFLIGVVASLRRQAEGLDGTHDADILFQPQDVPRPEARRGGP